MGTSFDEPIEKFLMRIKDYRLDRLRTEDETAFIEFLNSLVISSLSLFNSSYVDLSYTKIKKTSDTDNTLSDSEDVDTSDKTSDTSESKDESSSDISSSENMSEYYFDSVIDNDAIGIIAHIMVFRWVEREVNDITAMNEKLKTRDFNIVNTPQIFKSKTDYLNAIREEYLYEIQQYENKQILKNVKIEV